MKKEVKILIESMIVSFFVIIAFILYFLVNGYFSTKAYHNHPKVFDVYLETENHTHEVTIGWIKPLNWLEFISIYLIIFSIYFLIRFSLWKALKKRI